MKDLRVTVGSILRARAAVWGRRPAWHGLVLCASLGGWACVSSNGALFDAVPSPPDDSAPDPSSAEPAPAPEQTPPAEQSATATSSNSEANTAPRLPLSNMLPPASSPPQQGTTTPDPPAKPPPPAPPPSEPAGPKIVSISPADGAGGVKNDVQIVVTFDEPMDQAATEASYQSEQLPSGQVTFSWNADGTVLTITPKAALTYPTGTDPADVAARRIDFFISSAAQDLHGVTLAGPAESSFSLLRQINVTLPAVQDRNLTGNWRSDDTFGSGQCARDQINVCAGDSSNGGQYKGFISFDLSSLPGGIADVTAARLHFDVTARPGNPFGTLGALFLEHVSFDTIGPQAFRAAALANLGNVTTRANAGAALAADVQSALAADVGTASLSQFRLQFETGSDGDDNQDGVVSAWDSQSVDLTYLIP